MVVQTPAPLLKALKVHVTESNKRAVHANRVICRTNLPRLGDDHLAAGRGHGLLPERNSIFAWNARIEFQLDGKQIHWREVLHILSSVDQIRHLESNGHRLVRRRGASGRWQPSLRRSNSLVTVDLGSERSGRHRGLVSRVNEVAVVITAELSRYFTQEPKWNYDNPQLSEATNGFSQMMWASSDRFGCGQAMSDGPRGGTWTVSFACNMTISSPLHAHRFACTTHPVTSKVKRPRTFFRHVILANVLRDVK